MMKHIYKLACIIFVVIFTLSSVGCSVENDKILDDSVVEPQETAEAPKDTEEDKSERFDSILWNDNDDISSLDTPHIDFEYPESWNSVFFIEDYEEGDSYTLKFMGTDDLQDICIFYVRFGGSDDTASQLGWLGEVPVYVSVNEETDALNEEQLEKFYELQSCVNEIIVQIQYDDAFVR